MEKIKPWKMDSPDLAIPKGLSRAGRKACKVILAVLAENCLSEPSGGGCPLFRSPGEHRERGEQYGRESELIVLYDGGDAYPYFSYMSEAPGLAEKMRKALSDAGLWSEPCTGWYSAIYKD